MILKELHLHNFRNYEDLTVEFAPGVNVLIGENAQGKTNMLEAVYALALTRSHRTSNDRELINWKQHEALLSGKVQTKTDLIPLELRFTPKGKRAKVNHLEQSKLSSYVGQLNVIVFAPEDLALVKSGPAVRRHFMDLEFGQMSSKYLYNSGQYRTALRQRNEYLKQLRARKQSDRVFLQVLSDQVAASGAEMIVARAGFLQQLEKWAQVIHSNISTDKEELKFKYDTQVSEDTLSSVEDVYQALLALLTKNEDREIDHGSTLYGPHRDDLIFLVNGKNVQTYGSQGQQRTTALSVKLAEIDLMKEQTGEYPVLLLDDVLSELDDDRQTHLLTAIQDKVQTFLTTTSLSGIARQLINEPTIFNIAHGTLEREETK
ncbi:DNA replication/repair protein RecF [Paucilactobacillus suebicus]|uniref:DNA replication and repair protein RecF n=1 Tax=Paucilactobacillus suebicus DSM 5007 = KCTC 3549 TaxID=1423807 RepID=A0A0R1WCK0_9LACO|nr:DNA replication/repair protein RecF [Paucilactobacillus suebicus]KRM12646.1 recombination protein F [Paucilactobacillus suebicus DSM 5007 = KCTC 3549]